MKLVPRGVHTTPQAKVALLNAPSAAEGASAKRKSNLESAGNAMWLSRKFLVWRKLFHHALRGTIHLSLDGARSGGREAHLGVIYHCLSNVACWIPPVDC